MRDIGDIFGIDIKKYVYYKFHYKKWHINNYCFLSHPLR